MEGVTTPRISDITDLHITYTVSPLRGTPKTPSRAFFGAQKVLKFGKGNPEQGVVQPATAPYTPSHWFHVIRTQK